ncbi:MAG: IS110 family transposase [Spirochaetales bacterium]|nr:IS110 family transposase [Spirochaetales bacterium]
MKSLAYVGMDVHKETIAIAVFRDQNNKPEFEKEIRNTPGNVKKIFQRLQEKDFQIITCYEAGPTGFTLYRQLEKMNITCYVIAPSLIPQKPGERIKTDRRDALRLARCLRNQELTPIHIPTTSDEAVRDYLRLYEDFRIDLGRQRKRLLQFLNRNGKIYTEGAKYWTQMHRAWLRKLTFEEKIQQMVFEEYLTALEEWELKVKNLLNEIEEIAAQNRYREKVGKLRCFKGVETLTALSFIVEVGDFRRFSKAQSFMAYLGLVPSEYSSGNSRSLGRITKAGNSRLRRLLIESSWHYQWYSPSKRLRSRRIGQKSEVIAYADKAGKRLSKRYNQLLHRGKVKQKIVTAVAREMAGFIWGMMTDNTLLVA